jgi:hypothetical protein
MKKKATRGIYKSYFFKDHDPILDAIDRVYELSGMNNNGRIKFKEINELSNVSVTTLHNYRTRKTKRPRSDCVEAILRALGARRAVVYQEKVINYGNPKLTVVERRKTGT